MKKQAIFVASLALLGGSLLAGNAVADEACYGVVKAGENECSTSTNSCAGHATEDGLKDAYIYLPNGLCEKLVGGSLESS